MRIVYILAGAGGMYCGACNRDMNLVTTIKNRGYDIQIVPLYTPLRSDVIPTPQTSRIFYGGIITFLQQKVKFFRKAPRFIDYLVDNRALLNILGKITISTKPAKLGPLTVSVLAGENGNQNKELQKLIEYLYTVKPDVINITNSMLSGIAVSLKKEFNIPVICTLQGEEAFIASLPKPHCDEARDLLCQNAQHIDMFVAPHEKYATEMSSFLEVSPQKITTIFPGVDIEKYAFQKELPSQEEMKIGYLSRIAPEKGLDILLQAFSILQKKHQNISLHIAGQIYDKDFWKKLKRKHMNPKVIYHGELDFASKIKFLKKCHVFCVPSQFEESRGMAVLEAMAVGTPVVIPPVGIYSQLIEHTGNGILSGPSPKEFATSIEQIIESETSQQKYRSSDRSSFSEKYNLEIMVDQVIDLYKQLT